MSETAALDDEPIRHSPSTLSIFSIFLRLGSSSFGGPLAHLGYFRDEFVNKRRWLTEHAYADLVALCQFLPGPASSQVGMALGLQRGGLSGAVAAWAGFTLPSAIFLVLFGLGLRQLEGVLGQAWLHGLKIAALAIVAQAIWGMGKSLCPDRLRATFAGLAACTALLWPSAIGQIGIIVAGGICGRLCLHQAAQVPHIPFASYVRRRSGAIALGLFFLLLTLLPILAANLAIPALLAFDRFYRAGALVFGGGHVVLPLLQTELVSRGWVSYDDFLAGYGAAQAVPGPLFSFAAYLGAVSSLGTHAWLGALICLIGIFLPSFLLIVGVLPFWESLRRYRGMQSAMLGINAVVVGILLAAFYDPIWVSTIHDGTDFALALAALMLLLFWKIPPWLLVVLCALARAVMG